MLRRSVLISVGLYLLILFAAGCDRSSSADNGEDTLPLPEQKLAGVWLGFLNLDSSTFYFGIIDEENEVRLISNDSQFASAGPEDYFEIYPNTVIVQGALTELILSYSTTDFITGGSSWGFLGSILGTLLSGTYQDAVGNRESSFIFIYNTTYEVEPDIANISGTWTLANTLGVSGNPISLVITPFLDSTTSATIEVKRESGSAVLQSGTITIYYSGSTPYNIYDVRLTTLDGIELTGLAAYVEEVSTEGIDVPKTMAIGVSANSSGTYRSFSGLATQDD